MFKKTRYQQLPDYIKDEISEADFLTCYTNEQSNSNIIVWVINRETNKPYEFEYNPQTRSKLSPIERQQRAPSNSVTNIHEQNAVIATSYFFEPETNILREHYQVTDLTHMRNAGEQTEAYYSSFKQDPIEIAMSILKTYNFPTQYAQWNNQQRIDYWVERLYRMRRQAGESGAHEDCAFDKDLANEMESIDRDIKKILPDCIMKLSKIEQIDHADLLAAFRSRTGLMI